MDKAPKTPCDGQRKNIELHAARHQLLTVLSSHSQPSIYNTAQLQKLSAGNRVNGTHWQFTAKCTGCTSWTSRTGGTTYLNPRGNNRLALVISNGKPQQPSNSNSNLVMHENPIYWSQSFPEGANSNFADLVRRNGGTTTADTEETVTVE
jgi:hypothetical protein